MSCPGSAGGGGRGGAGGAEQVGEGEEDQDGLGGEGQAAGGTVVPGLGRLIVLSLFDLDTPPQGQSGRRAGVIQRYSVDDRMEPMETMELMSMGGHQTSGGQTILTAAAKKQVA